MLTHYVKRFMLKKKKHFSCFKIANCYDKKLISDDII